MASGDGSDKKDMTFGMGWDAEKMLRLYIYSYMKKKGLDHVADIFKQEANLHLFPVLDSEEGLLKEWWESFWPIFSSRLENNAGENWQSSTQSSMQAAIVMQPSPGDIPVGNPQNEAVDPSHLPNQQIFASGGSSMVEQPPESLLATSPIYHQRRAGKLPMNNDTDSTPGRSSVQVIRKRPLGFTPLIPAELVPFDINQMVDTAPPPSGDPSSLHLPAIVQSSLQVTEDPRNDFVGEKSDQIESDRL